MNYLQLDNIKYTILRHSPLKSTVTWKPRIRDTQLKVSGNDNIR